MKLTYCDRFEDEPALLPYANVRERDLVGREGKFIAEGEVVLRVLAEARPDAIESVLLSEKRVAKLTSLLESISAPIWVLPDAAMEALTGIDLHRGILALGRRLEAPTARAAIAGAESPSSPAIALGLIGLVNHDNVGGIFRNAAAFGARGVLIDDLTCDPLYRKAIRVSVGGVFKVPFFRGGSATEMLEHFEREGYECFAFSPSGREEIAEIAPPPRAALLLGAEGPGLPDEILARTRTVRIDMAPGFDSLNVSATSAIALHRLRGPSRAR